jgi:hypothetical protein
MHRICLALPIQNIFVLFLFCLFAHTAKAERSLISIAVQK